MNIDKIREALEAAIEEHSRLNASYGTIIAKVREALAELDKPAEPVAWMVKTRIGVEWVRTLGVTKTGARQIAIERYRNGSDVQHMDPIPLYTHPPQAAGLTVEEAEDCLVEHLAQYGPDWSAPARSRLRARLTAAIQAKQ